MYAGLLKSLMADLLCSLNGPYDDMLPDNQFGLPSIYYSLPLLKTTISLKVQLNSTYNKMRKTL